MALTYQVRYRLKVYDLNRELLAIYPDKLTFSMPWFDYQNHPGTGIILNGIFVEDLYLELQSWCPDITLSTIMSLCPFEWDHEEYPTVPPTNVLSYMANLNTKSHWPSWLIFNVPETGSPSDFIWVLEFDSGKVLTWRLGTGSRAYETLADFEEGNQPVASSGIEGSSEVLDRMDGNWTGDSRGQFNILGYITVDETNKPNTFASVAFRGGASMSNVVSIYSYNEQTTGVNHVLEYIFEDAIIISTTDPYVPINGGDEEPDPGGNGAGFWTGENIDFPAMPDISATQTGMVSLFTPSLANINSLANYMWSNDFNLDAFKKLFADPMDCILGLSIVPGPVPAGSGAIIKIGNVSTNVSMPRVANQYFDVDCGSLSIPEQWGAYLDYEPYSKLSIYLPYIGIHPISVDDVMGKTISVKYRVDCLSGACVAMIKCGGSVLYSFNGHCASSIPVASKDWSTMINGVLSIAGAGISMVASGGATAPFVLPGIASTAINSLKPSIEKSGSLSGSGGLLGIQKPFLIFQSPRMINPCSDFPTSGQNRFIGYPIYKEVLLSSQHGYTEVETIHLENVPATDEEMREIETILKSGVIL